MIHLLKQFAVCHTHLSIILLRLCKVTNGHMSNCRKDGVPKGLRGEAVKMCVKEVVGGCK